MKRIIYIVAGLIALTAVIGTALWANGFPPPKEGLSETKAMLRAIVTFPLFFAGLSTLVSVPILLLKAGRYNSMTGKARILPKISMLAMPMLMLFVQIIMPLDLYDMVSEKAADLMFYGFMTGFFLLIGNYLVTVPFESRMGFRTKAALSDPVIWMKTHRFLGRNIVIMSLLMIPTGVLTNTDAAQWGLIVVVMLIKGIAYIYARQLAVRAALRNTPA